MNIIVLSPEAIFPPNTGGRIVVYNKIKYLSEMGHRISVLCIVDSDEEGQDQVQGLKDYVVSIKSYNRNRTKIANLIRSIFLPFAVASRTNTKLIADLKKLIVDFDILLVEFPQMMENIFYTNIKDVKVILSEHNIESDSMKSIAETIDNPIKKIIYLFDAMRLNQFERKILKKNAVDLYTFVSGDDQSKFNAIYNTVKKPTLLVPIGAEQHDGFRRDANTHNVIIVGKMSYLPNVEGVLWFYNKIWNKVANKVQDAKLYIVGKDPDDRIKNIDDPSVEITGTVESVEPFYREGSVAVIPLFTGGGVKTKLIEASSYGIPIVCTTFGAVGTEFKNQVHAVITDDEHEFVDGIVDALNNSAKVNNMVENARKLFMEKYEWKSIVEDLSSAMTKP